MPPPPADAKANAATAATDTACDAPTMAVAAAAGLTTFFVAHSGADDEGIVGDDGSSAMRNGGKGPVHTIARTTQPYGGADPPSLTTSGGRAIPSCVPLGGGTELCAPGLEGCSG